MSDPTLAIRKAVLDKLNAAALGVPVYSRVPDNDAPPYVLIDAVRLAGATNKAGTAWDASVDVLSIAQSPSPAPTEELMARVTAALHRQALTHVTATLFPPRLESSDPEFDADRKIWIGRQSYRLNVQV